MNKEWFCSNEISKLPGSPTSDFRVREKAKREGWKSRPKAQGKGLEYHISSLPEETRCFLMQQQGAVQVEPLPTTPPQTLTIVRNSEGHQMQAIATHTAPTQSALRPLVERGERSTRKALARKRVLAALHLLLDGAKQKDSIMAGFVTAYNAGQVEVPTDTYEAIPKVSVRTLYLWEREYLDSGVQGLADAADGKRGRKSLAEQRPELVAKMEAFICQSRQVSASHIYRHVIKLLPKAEQPSRRTIERWCQEWAAAHPDLACWLDNPGQWKSRYAPAFGRADGWVTEPNMLWEIDGSPTDVVLRGAGRNERWALISVVDVYTRRNMMILSKTISSDAVLALLFTAFREWGLPQCIRTDQGEEFRSVRLRTALELLEIRHEAVQGYSGDKKPFVERMFRTLQHGRLELLPGYVGHNVGERKGIDEGRRIRGERPVLLECALSSEEFQQFVNECCEIHNATIHRGTGEAPVARAAGFAPRKVADERALVAALMPMVTRTVSKHGVAWNNVYYGHEALARWVGRKVVVHAHPWEADAVWISACDDGRPGDYICKALNLDTMNQVQRQALATGARKIAERTMREEYAQRRGLRSTYEEQIESAHAQELAEARRLSLFPVAATAVEVVPPAHVTAALEDEGRGRMTDAEREALEARYRASEAKLQELAQVSRIFTLNDYEELLGSESISAADAALMRDFEVSNKWNYAWESLCDTAQLYRSVPPERQQRNEIVRNFLRHFAELERRMGGGQQAAM